MVMVMMVRIPNNIENIDDGNGGDEFNDGASAGFDFIPGFILGLGQVLV